MPVLLRVLKAPTARHSLYALFIDMGQEGDRVKKRILAALAALPLCFLLTAQAAPEVSVPSAILVDAATGTVLFEKNAQERLRPASVTKIMTLLLTMEAIESGNANWDDTVTASAAACAKGGSQVFLAEGEQMRLDEMVKSVCVASANDCAAALAEHLAGSESAFVDRMNERAKELGMADTHFVNCTGLDDDPEAAEHLTTAADIAKMSRELLKHDGIRKYLTIWMDTVRGGQFGLSNTNKLVRFYEGTTGLKTGYTSAAGHCISASARRDGLELIAVVLHAASSPERFEAAKTLLSHGFAHYALAHPEAEPVEIPVVLGTRGSVRVEPESREPILVEKAQKNQIVCETETEGSADAPVTKGQRLGTLRVRAGETLLKEIPLVAAEDVPCLGFGEQLVRLLRRVCCAEL